MAAAAAAASGPGAEVNAKIAAQGDKIRDMKANKADKAAIKAEVDVLLKLKAEFKEKTGEDWKPADPAEKKKEKKSIKLLKLI